MKKFGNLLGVLIIGLVIGLTSCNNKGDSNSDSDSTSTSSSEVLYGYWERTSGGDHEDDVALIIGFFPEDKMEKIVLYDENSDNSKGYREIGEYKFDELNILRVFGEGYPVTLSKDKLVFDDMAFKKVSKDEVKNRISKLKKLEEDGAIRY